jgi:serine/threonine protein kinase
MQWSGTPPVAAEHATDFAALLDLRLEGSVRPAIAGYRLVRRIGRGRRATTWLACDLRDRSPVALKLADRAGGSFAREFTLAAAAAHPHVLRVLEHGVAGGTAYLAMEYLPEGDLARRMTAGVSAAQAIEWLRQAAAGLSQLHGNGLVHRDVKPANFLLRADGSLVLADFGLVTEAGSVDPQARPGSLVGTPRYVSPEQLQGAPAAPAADVYSLGVLFHELLCGTPPFGGETLMEVLSQHLVAPAPQLPAALAGWQALADAMLAKDAGSRLPHAGLVPAWIASLQHEACATTPAGATGKRW